MRFPVFACRLTLIASRTVASMAFTFFFDGRALNFPSYLRRCCPRKSNPSVIGVIQVFIVDNSNPRSLRNLSPTGLTSFSRSSFVLPVMMKSSAYRIRLTLCRLLRYLVGANFLRHSCSSPSRVIFASPGEIIPPWGVPLSVGYQRCRLTYPTFHHLLSMPLSMGILANNQS